MDRVDRWLTARRGWRRLLIGWLFLAPVLVDLGLLWSGWGKLDDQANVPTGSVLLHIAIAVLAGIPLAAVLVWQRMLLVRSRPWEPVFSWRMIVAVYVFMAGACAASYGETRNLTWQQRHVPSDALFLTDAAFFVLLIWTVLYHRKLRRRFERAQEQAS